MKPILQVLLCQVVIWVILFIYSFHSSPEEVQSIISGKLALRYAGRDIDAMKCIATASQNRSLSEFQDVSFN